jgi:hypothetical protein
MSSRRDKAGTLLFWAILNVLFFGLGAVFVLVFVGVILGLLRVIAWLS